jgi:uncharacterized protein YbjT (DUF2867 family)
MVESSLFFVVGGTGTQGGFTARHLLQAGARVRALVRDPLSEKARLLESLGAELVQGDLNDAEALLPALEGVAGVFSVLRPDDGTDSELRQGLGLVAAAKRAGVPHFVHSSVCQVDEREDFPGWASGRWSQKYWNDKWAIEEAVRGADFARWTILRPSFILQNLLPPKAMVLYPQLSRGELLAPIDADAPVQVIAGEDIGRFGAAALLDPARFDGETIELSAGTMTIGEMAATLSETLNLDVRPNSVSADEALAAGMPAPWVRSQEWINEAGYNVDESLLPEYGVPLTSFASWISAHRDEFAIKSFAPTD